MQTTTGLGIDSVVRITSCESCPAVVGKVARIRHFDSDNDNLVSLSFGRGRPQKDRPALFHISGLEVVEQENTDG